MAGPAEPADVRQRLDAGLAQNAEQLSRLALAHTRLIEASESSNADDEHDPEGATIAYEREQLTAMQARLQATRSHLLAALEQVDAGTYGTCERCGRPIAPGRLEARPGARTCITCAQSISRR